MTSITEALLAAFGPDPDLAVPALFVRPAVGVQLSATVLAAIFIMNATPIVSETRRKTHLLRNKIKGNKISWEPISFVFSRR
jgi:hypothetical protein